MGYSKFYQFVVNVFHSTFHIWFYIYPIYIDTAISEEQSPTANDVVGYIRGNFFIPDARKYWIKPSVNFLKKFIILSK